MQVAIIGCGWAGSRHARAFVQALADRGVTAVAICLPHHLHATVAVAAAEAGKHILVEKPLAATLAEADAMIAAAERAGVQLMVAENVVFNPLYLAVRELLQQETIGRPALVQRAREAYLQRSFLTDRPWFLDARAAAGGIMMSGGVHDFALLLLLIGEIESVYALRARQRLIEMEGDDTSIASLRFRDGTIGTLVESFIMKSLVTASGPEIHTLRIDGDLGSLVVHDHDQTIEIFSERPDLQRANSLTRQTLLVPATDTFVAEIQHFLACIETGQEPCTSGRRQRRPLELVLAAYRSMEIGQPVDVR